jgi:hypothetical protein
MCPAGTSCGANAECESGNCAAGRCQPDGVPARCALGESVDAGLCGQAASQCEGYGSGWGAVCCSKTPIGLTFTPLCCPGDAGAVDAGGCTFSPDSGLFDSGALSDASAGPDARGSEGDASPVRGQDASRGRGQGAADASRDAPRADGAGAVNRPSAGGGCGCRASRGRETPVSPALLCLALTVVGGRIRRRRSERSASHRPRSATRSG